MAKDEDDTARHSLRSIPPIARASFPLAQPQPDRPSTWLWAIGALAVAVGVATGALRLGFSGQNAHGAGAVPEESAEPGPGLRTEIVRDAPLHRMAGPARSDGRRAVAIIPRSAVTRLDGRPMVYVADRNLKLLVATPVELGATEGDQQRVLSGVSAGQVIIAEGSEMVQRQATTR